MAVKLDPYSPIDTKAMAEAYSKLTKRSKRESPEYLNALAALYPMLGYVRIQLFSTVDDIDAEDLMSAGAQFLVDVLDNQWIEHGSHPAAIFKFLRKSIYRIYARTLHMYAPEEFDFEGNLARFPQGTTTSPETIFATLYSDDIERQINRLYNSMVRFTGRERKACDYVFSRLRQDKLVSNEILKRDFGFSQGRRHFFISYCTVLYRQILYIIREDFSYGIRRKLHVSQKIEISDSN